MILVIKINFKIYISFIFSSWLLRVYYTTKSNRIGIGIFSTIRIYILCLSSQDSPRRYCRYISYKGRSFISITCCPIPSANSFGIIYQTGRVLHSDSETSSQRSYSYIYISRKYFSRAINVSYIDTSTSYDKFRLIYIKFNSTSRASISSNIIDTKVISIFSKI